MAEVIRRKSTARNQRIGVVSFDTDAGAIGRALENAGETLRQTAYKIDAAAAEKAGIEAANAIESSKFKSFDADGNPVVLKAPEGYGRIAREAYQKVVEQRFVDTMDNDIRLEAKKLRVKHDRNPLGFQNEMDAYLTTLAGTSDGRFREYVNNIGNAVKEATYVGLLEDQRNRSRANNGEFIVKTNTESLNDIAVMSANGASGVEDALSFAFQRASATEEGVKSDILKDGATQNYINEAVGVAASSFIIAEATRQNFTQLERAELTNLIRTFGGSLENTKSEKVKQLYQQNFSFTAGDETRQVTVKDLIKGSNRRNVMAEINAAFSDADAVDAIIKRNQAEADDLEKVEFGKREDRFDIDVNDTIDLDAAYSSQQSRNAFAEGGNIDTAVFNISKRFDKFERKVDTEVKENPNYTSAEGKRDIDRQKFSLALPLIKRAAATGDANNFMAALTTLSTTSEAFKLATKEQQEVIIALDKYNLLDENMLGQFSAEIGKSESAVVEALKREDVLLDQQSEFEDLLIDLDNGNASQSDVDKFFSSFDKATKGFVGVGETKEKLKKQVEGLQARDKLYDILFSPANNNSSFMKSVAHYIRTGKDGDFIKEQDRKQIDNIIKDLVPSIKQSIAADIEKTSVDKYQLEESGRKVNEFNEDISKFNKGQLSPSKSSEVSQLLLDTKGFDVSNRDTWTEENMRIAAKGMPENIVNELRTFTSLGVANNADNLLMFWGMMYQYRMPNGKLTNTTERFFTDEEELKLRYALKSRQLGRTSNAVQAMQEVNNLFQEPTKTQVEARKEELFGTNQNGTVRSVKQFLRDPKVLGNDYDVMVASELADYTNFLVASNLPPAQIVAEVKQKFNQRYKEAQYVFDPSRPLGSKSRTRHALDAYLAPPEKDFFVNSVESQLNEFGYTLYDHVNEQPIGQIFDATKDQKGFTPVVLLPMFPELVRAEDQTFMPMKIMFLDELGTYELQPIIIHEGTDKEMTAAFQISDEMKNYIGSADSVDQRLSAEELKELFDRATTVLGGNREKPVPLY